MLDPARFTLSTINKVHFSHVWNKISQGRTTRSGLRAGSDDISSAFHKIRCRFDGEQCGRMADCWWAWPDGCCSLFLQSKTNFLISASNDFDWLSKRQQQRCWCFNDEKPSWWVWFKSQKPAGLALLHWCYLVSYNYQSARDATAHVSASHRSDWSLPSNPWASHTER